MSAIGKAKPREDIKGDFAASEVGPLRWKAPELNTGANRHASERIGDLIEFIESFAVLAGGWRDEDCDGVNCVDSGFDADPGARKSGSIIYIGREGSELMSPGSGKGFSAEDIGYAEPNLAFAPGIELAPFGLAGNFFL
jgi:hypothetical protein